MLSPSLPGTSTLASPSASLDPMVLVLRRMRAPGTGWPGSLVTAIASWNGASGARVPRSSSCGHNEGKSDTPNHAHRANNPVPCTRDNMPYCRGGVSEKRHPVGAREARAGTFGVALLFFLGPLGHLCFQLSSELRHVVGHPYLAIFVIAGPIKNQTFGKCGWPFVPRPTRHPERVGAKMGPARHHHIRIAA